MERDGPRLLYEGAEGSGGDGVLKVLPTYAIVAAHPSIYSIPLAEYIPGAKMVRYSCTTVQL